MGCFNNTYYIMRHGQSEANELGVIISDPNIGCHEYGLTKEGRKQVKNSLISFEIKQLTSIVSSDFLRAKETAYIVASHFKVGNLIIKKGLRERYFGIWEGKSDEHYHAIWKQDELGYQSLKSEIEITKDVLLRTIQVLMYLEKNHHNATLLLVSHGDTLQILQTFFLGKQVYQHRHLPHIKTAEIKMLASMGTTFPVSWEKEFDAW